MNIKNAVLEILLKTIAKSHVVSDGWQRMYLSWSGMPSRQLGCNRDITMCDNASPVTNHSSVGSDYGVTCLAPPGKPLPKISEYLGRSALVSLILPTCRSTCDCPLGPLCGILQKTVMDPILPPLTLEAIIRSEAELTYSGVVSGKSFGDLHTRTQGATYPVGVI